jgi:hypothetical protein
MRTRDRCDRYSPSARWRCDIAVPATRELNCGCKCEQKARSKSSAREPSEAANRTYDLDDKGQSQRQEEEDGELIRHTHRIADHNQEHNTEREQAQAV